MKTHQEIAADALAILDRDGWCKDYLTMPWWSVRELDGFTPGSHCIGGAVNIAACRNEQWDYRIISFYQRLAGKIAEMYPERLKENNDLFALLPGKQLAGQIAAWNNHPRTTEDDVRAVLEKIRAEES